MDEFEEAITRVIAGPEKKSRTISEHDRKLTAYHEAGHAVVMKCLKNSDPVHEISIIPREWLEDIQCIFQQKIEHIHQKKSY